MTLLEKQSVTTGIPVMEKLRVGIRGAGHLGTRLTAAIHRQPDMETSIIVGRKDPMQPRWDEELKQVNPETTVVFSHTDDPDVESSIQERVDVFIDATSQGTGRRYLDAYTSYGIPVVVQASERGVGSLASAPVVPEGTTIVRQGDCNVSGLVPVFWALSDIMDRVTVSILMLSTSVFNTKADGARVNGIDFGSGEYLEEDLSRLFPNLDVSVRPIVRTGGLTHYLHTIDLVTTARVEKEEIHELLIAQPRIRCLDGVTSSWYAHELKELLRARGKNIAPITPLTELTVQDDPKHLTLHSLINPHWITVYANVDLARVLGKHTDPTEAMRQTDEAMALA